MKLSDYHPGFEGWTAAPAMVLMPASPAIPNDQTQVTPYLRAVLPLPLQYSGDTIKQYNRPGLSSFRTPPLPPSGNAAVNAATKSIIKILNSSNASGVLLETNGIRNASQSVLNLEAGANISLASDGTGGVSITGTAGGDGLIHGDAIWETDSAYVFLRDEFLMGGTGTSPIGAGNVVGALDWTLSSNTGGFQVAVYQTGLAPINLGEVSWTNSNTNNSTVTQGIANIAIGTNSALSDTLIQSWPILALPSWKATFIWRFHRSTEQVFNGGILGPNFSKKSMYIGLANNIAIPANGWSRPPIFIGARYDTDTTAPAISDSHIILEAVQNTLPNGVAITRNNAQGTTFDTGITPTEDAYYRLDIQCLVAGTVTMSINGAAPQTFTLPKYIANAGTAGTDIGVAGHGQAELILGNVGGNIVNHPFGAGAPITVAGFGGGASGLNGSFISNAGIADAASNDRVRYALAATIAGVAPGGWSITGFTSLLPIFMFGNDSQAAPATDTRICIDYFSFVWNPGVGGGTGTPVATKPRYF